jgi:hypothetical protein
MNEGAIRLTEDIFPTVPVRQWVLSCPFYLRYLMAYDPRVVSAVLKIQTRAIAAWYKKKHKGLFNPRSLHTGSVTAIQRFGGALNINPHFHSLFIDGVYLKRNGSSPLYLRAAPLFDVDKEKILRRIVQKTINWLTSNGYIESELNVSPALAEIHAASVEYRISVGPRRGEKIQLFGPETYERKRRGEALGFCGFNLHADVRVKASSREKLERLCRYILRGPLSRERVHRVGGGKIAIRFKKPWSSGATHVIYTEEEFVEKLVALVPPRHANLVRYHGVFAPNARLRREVCPKRAPIEAIQKRVSQIPWAELLKRTFGIDPERCNRCGGKLRPIAVIVRYELIDQILKSLKIKSCRLALGESRDPRGPPNEWFSVDYDQLPTDW